LGSTEKEIGAILRKNFSKKTEISEWLISLKKIGGGKEMEFKPKDKAPDFSLPDQEGKRVSLSEFRGRKVLLFFYPKAGTSG